MSIVYLEKHRLFEIRTARTSYLFGVNEKGTVQHLYWGAPVEAADCAGLLRGRHHSSFDADVDRETEEYGGWGGCGYAEPGLKATFADGVRDVRLNYEGYEIWGDNELVLRLKDEHYELRVDVRYKAVPEHDLIERYVQVSNGEAQPVRIEQVMAAIWSVQRLPAYRMTHVAGRWAGEYQLRRTFLSEGKKTIESRRGFTGPHANPWLAIDDGSAGEETGSVWFGALGWSGNWKIVAEKTTFGHVRIAGGVNDFDGAFSLAPGASYTSPVFVGGFTAGGFGGMSRSLHRYERECVLPTRKLRKVLYNSWEATEFAVTAEGQKALARQAARLGVERFVVDDGWFGQRHSDRAGLGDWYVNPEKFPNGLQELIDEVKSLGMEFGLWVEPESVNPDSELYRKHPEWTYQFPTRTGTQLRNQLLLNLGLPEVKSFVLGFMTDLLSTYDIRFIKWDMNRTVTEPGVVPLREHFEESGRPEYDGHPEGAVSLGGAEPWTGSAGMEGIEHSGGSVWLRHAEHLYEIWAELRARFPDVEFETCAGGGSRIDLGILRYADQAWISDNTDARDRLAIQEGFSYAYAPAVMMCWVTESPHGFNGRSLPLSYRFHSSMMGGLGIGADIGKWPDDEIAEAAAYVELYKRIRPIVLEGDLYRLEPLGPGNGQERSNLAVYEYVGPDGEEAVAFVFLQSQHFGSELLHLPLRGLDPQAAYEVRVNEGEPAVRSGSTLLHLGVPIGLRGDYKSLLIRLKKLP
ncbi:alpha-galactosidase [Cohnella zeiphila]|uniref:alpha-galactosidase n=1 Tax=Cohnella zeiphila TaxID=2761120 RepID=UPI001EE2F5D4|nr:alpha-galactosidase [Cohnella zeiphila]